MAPPCARPYACPICGESFMKWSLCLNHVRGSVPCRAALGDALNDLDQLQEACRIAARGAPADAQGSPFAAHGAASPASGASAAGGTAAVVAPASASASVAGAGAGASAGATAGSAAGAQALPQAVPAGLVQPASMEHGPGLTQAAKRLLAKAWRRGFVSQAALATYAADSELAAARGDVQVATLKKFLSPGLREFRMIADQKAWLSRCLTFCSKTTNRPAQAEPLVMALADQALLTNALPQVGGHEWLAVPVPLPRAPDVFMGREFPTAQARARALARLEAEATARSKRRLAQISSIAGTFWERAGDRILVGSAPASPARLRRAALLLGLEAQAEQQPMGCIGSIPEELEAGCTRLRVPAAASEAAFALAEAIEKEGKVLLFWTAAGDEWAAVEPCWASADTAPEAGAPVVAWPASRDGLVAWQPGKLVAADLEGGTAVVRWDADGKKMRLPLSRVRPKLEEEDEREWQRKRWLSEPWGLYIFGSCVLERRGAALRLMALCESKCPGLWSSELDEAVGELTGGDAGAKGSSSAAEDAAAAGVEAWLMGSDAVDRRLALRGAATRQGRAALRRAAAASGCHTVIIGTVGLFLVGPKEERRRTLDYLQWLLAEQRQRTAVLQASRVALRTAQAQAGADVPAKAEAAEALEGRDADERNFREAWAAAALRDDVAVVPCLTSQSTWAEPSEIRRIEKETKTVILLDHGPGASEAELQELESAAAAALAERAAAAAAAEKLKIAKEEGAWSAWSEDWTKDEDDGWDAEEDWEAGESEAAGPPAKRRRKQEQQQQKKKEQAEAARQLWCWRPQAAASAHVCGPDAWARAAAVEKLAAMLEKIQVDNEEEQIDAKEAERASADDGDGRASASKKAAAAWDGGRVAGGGAAILDSAGASAGEPATAIGSSGASATEQWPEEPRREEASGALAEPDAVPAEEAEEVVAPVDARQALRELGHWPMDTKAWIAVQDVVWAGHPRLKPGWIRVWSRSKDSEYYYRVEDGKTTFQLREAS
eukprot:TRINITY_DN29236_c1_g4_i1.p1 TRINITY_DN29236_c1_g4~~TRINITY_DN29236_c1_g4_i1.p1  ORF type:complete len:1008 (+),score=293.12 TRINITY_DN29236_c1_g4_i1:57-3080(+)